jgi:hypothetical protein
MTSSVPGARNLRRSSNNYASASPLPGSLWRTRLDRTQILMLNASRVGGWPFIHVPMPPRGSEPAGHAWPGPCAQSSANGRLAGGAWHARTTDYEVAWATHSEKLTG